MKQRRLLALATLCAVLLGGCAVHPRGGGGSAPGQPDPERPKVTISGDKLAVNQPVLAFKAGGAPVTIRWELDAKSGYRFTENGIVIEGRITDDIVRGARPSVVLEPRQDEIVDCKLADKSGLAFTCVNRLRAPGVFKYTIRVTDGKTERVLDPFVANW